MIPPEPLAALPVDPGDSRAGVAGGAPVSQDPAALSGWQRFGLWLGGSALACAGIAWLAFQIRLGGHAPEVLFPVGVGVALGLALLVVARKSHWQGSRSIVAMALVWGAIAVLGQEYLAHREHVRNFLEAQQRPTLPAFARLAAADLPPPDLWSDFRFAISQRGAWLWSFDALAVVLACTVLVAWKLGVWNVWARKLRAAVGGAQPVPAEPGSQRDAQRLTPTTPEAS